MRFPTAPGSSPRSTSCPSTPIEEIEAQAPACCSSSVRNPEALILTDVFGATPCNVAQRLADGVQVKVVAGVNVPMLWRSLCYSGDIARCRWSRGRSPARPRA